MSPRLRGVVGAAVVVVLLAVVVLLQTAIDDTVDESRLRPPVDADLAPRLFVGTVLLGPFRAVAADMTWNRTVTLLDQRRYWRLAALYELIATLQPYFQEVWIFNSWNMAYNVSLNGATTEERWRWVREGIRYAIQGTQINPDGWRIHQWLGWLYFHRCVVLEPGLEALLRDDDVNPRGLSATALALESLARARRIPGHDVETDLVCLRVLGYLLDRARSAADLRGVAELRDRIAIVIEHLETEHAPEGRLYAEELRRRFGMAPK